MADYRQNTKANLPHKSQSYSSVFDSHPIFSNIGGWVVDTTTGALKYKFDRDRRGRYGKNTSFFHKSDKTVERKA